MINYSTSSLFWTVLGFFCSRNDNKETVSKRFSSSKLGRFETGSKEWDCLIRQGEGVTRRLKGQIQNRPGISARIPDLVFERKQYNRASSKTLTFTQSLRLPCGMRSLFLWGHAQDGICGEINAFRSIYTVNMETAQAAMAMKKSINSLAF